MKKIKAPKTVEGFVDILADVHSKGKKSYNMSTFKNKDESRSERKEGEVWNEGDVEYIKKNGIVMTSKAALIEEATKEYKMPISCPNCNAHMKGRLDEKMWKIHKLCFNCAIKKENKMRVEGTWDSFEENKMDANIKSYLKDKKQELEESLKLVRNRITFIQNSQGDIEEWKASKDLICMIEGNIQKNINDVDKYLSMIENKKYKGEENGNI